MPERIHRVSFPCNLDARLVVNGVHKRKVAGDAPVRLLNPFDLILDALAVRADHLLRCGLGEDGRAVIVVKLIGFAISRQRVAHDRELPHLRRAEIILVLGNELQCMPAARHGAHVHKLADFCALAYGLGRFKDVIQIGFCGDARTARCTRHVDHCR